MKPTKDVMNIVKNLTSDKVNKKLVKAFNKAEPAKPTIYDKSFYKGIDLISYHFDTKRLIINCKGKKTVSFIDAHTLATHIDKKVKIISIVNITDYDSVDYSRKGKKWNTLLDAYIPS